MCTCPMNAEVTSCMSWAHTHMIIDKEKVIIHIIIAPLLNMNYDTFQFICIIHKVYLAAYFTWAKTPPNRIIIKSALNATCRECISMVLILLNCASVLERNAHDGLCLMPATHYKTLF